MTLAPAASTRSSSATAIGTDCNDAVDVRILADISTYVQRAFGLKSVAGGRRCLELRPGASHNGGVGIEEGLGYPKAHSLAAASD